MPLDLTAAIGPILGGFISGIIGIVTANYSSWRNQQADIEDWYARIDQKIQYTTNQVGNVVEEADSEQPTLGEMNSVSGSINQYLDELDSELKKQQYTAPTEIDPEVLIKIDDVRQFSEEIKQDPVREGSKLRDEDNPLQTLKEDVRDKKADISSGLIPYIRLCIKSMRQ